MTASEEPAPATDAGTVQVHREPARDPWIWWILALAAVLRLVHIQAQPIGYHGWRQADTAAVARNFHQGGYRLFFPEVDWETPGHVEMEFPIYPWVVSLAYAMFGERIALARAAAVLASLATVYMLFLLVRHLVGREPALWAALLWAVLPLTVHFGRAVMPEAWMLAFSVASVGLFFLWTQRRGGSLLIAAAACLGMASLLKPTSLGLGLPLLWLARHRLRSSAAAHLQLAGFAALVGIPLVLWYGHAYRLGEATGATFGVLTGPGAKAVRWDLLLQAGFYNRVFLEFFANRLLTWVGFALFLFALFLRRRSQGERLFDWWLAGAILVLIASGGGSYHHDYYALPAVIPAVAHMGRALAWIRARSSPLLVILLVGLGITSVLRWSEYLALETATSPGNSRVVQDLLVARVLAQHTASADRIVSCNETDPTWLYLSRRKGWGRNCDALDKRAVAALRDRGARYLVARQGDFESPHGTRLREYLLKSHRALYDDGKIVLLGLAPLNPEERRWLTLLADDFQDGRLPPGWRFESGRWEERDGFLVAEPVRRQSRALVDGAWSGCTFCTIRIALSTERKSQDERRAVVSIRGWWTGDTYTEAALDLSRGAISLTRSEGGSVVGFASRELPLAENQIYAIELGFDNFDFELALDSQPVLSLPHRGKPLPFGGLGVSARNLRVAFEALSVLQPLDTTTGGGQLEGVSRSRDQLSASQSAARLGAGSG